MFTVPSQYKEEMTDEEIRLNPISPLKRRWTEIDWIHKPIIALKNFSNEELSPI